MKQILILCMSIMAAMGLLTLAQASNQVPPEDVLIFTPPPPGSTPHVPAIVPFSCYLYRSLGAVSLQSSSITTPAQVTVENIASGIISQENILISSIPSSISLFGPGQYTITITLSSGTQYYGSFSY